MVRTVEAIYEKGVLRLLEPLDLAEGQRVRVTVDDLKDDVPTPDVHPRQEGDLH